MLIVRIHNDSTGDSVTANYNVGVFITVSLPGSLEPRLKRIAKARIHHHKRADGWRELLKRVAFEAEDEAETGL